jgi:gamma-glutamyltranspeptidase/glutathione hydrolase
MMSPTVVLDQGAPEIAIGSAGSNRIRSAILQTVLGIVDHGLAAQDAVSAPRLHVEEGQVDAEPGLDPAALDRLEEARFSVRRWGEPNLFFGGVQAVARNPNTGELTGGGDPRRGGAVSVVS